MVFGGVVWGWYLVGVEMVFVRQWVVFGGVGWGRYLNLHIHSFLLVF